MRTNNELKGLLAHYKKSQAWYSKSLDVLGPLRYHMSELLLEIESHNRFLKRIKVPRMPTAKVKAAKKALAKAEKFFCNKAS